MTIKRIICSQCGEDYTLLASLAQRPESKGGYSHCGDHRADSAAARKRFAPPPFAPANAPPIS